MTKKKFEKHIKRKYRFEIISSCFTCILTILAGLFSPYFISRTFYFWPPSIIFISIGVIGLLVLRSKYNPSILNNGLTKDENKEKIKAVAMLYTGKTIELRGSVLIFIYRRSWWQRSFAVNLTADHGMIGASAQSGTGSRGGFIDFGASKRLEKEILNNIL